MPNPVNLPPSPIFRWPSLTAAPHRLLFFVGATNVLAAMLWWWMSLSGYVSRVVPGLPQAWMHGFLMQYQVLPAFMFGFLLTVYPRWMGQKEATRWHYLPVGLALLSGQALTLVAAWHGSSLALHLGWLNTLAGWVAAMMVLSGWIRHARTRDIHVWSTFLALAVGLAGLVLFGLWLPSGALAYAQASIRIGAAGLLLPIYATVAHRMFPFFAGNAVAGYAMYRPPWALIVMWCGVLLHLVCELADASAWRWPADLVLASLFGWLLWRWWPRAKAPPLLIVLFAGFIWLPVAMLLYAVDSASLMIEGVSSFGRAPLHALVVGFFGSLLVAMVTRVTAGHSGRPLMLGPVAAFAFAGMHLVALMRVGADLMPNPLVWWQASALAWLLVFLPWVLRSVWIYTMPRVDGKPG